MTLNITAGAPSSGRGGKERARLSLLALLWVTVAAGCARRTGSADRAGDSPQPSRVVHPDTAPATQSFLEANRQAGAAIRDRKWALAASYMDEAERHAPNHPVVLGFVARLRAASGDTVSAVRALRRLAALGLAGPTRNDTTMLALLRNPQLADVGRQLDHNARAIVTSDTAFVIPQADLLVEGITHAPGAGRGTPVLYLGSMATGEILRVDLVTNRIASTTQFVVTDGRPLGMKADASGRLWVNVWARNPTATAAGPRPLNRPASSSLDVYDLRTGALLHRLASPADTLSHQFNDLALTRSGEAYVTDTDASQVFRISPKDSMVTSIVSGITNFSYPNGIALSADESRLYVAHLEGISVWDLTSGVRRRLMPPADAAVTGIDGLYACRGSLVAIQQMAGFARVSRFRLSRDGYTITRSEVLEQNHAAYAMPTTGTIADGVFYYIATSEVARHKPDGGFAPPTRTSNTVILRRDLRPRCD